MAPGICRPHAGQPSSRPALKDWPPRGARSGRLPPARSRLPSYAEARQERCPPAAMAVRPLRPELRPGSCAVQMGFAGSHAIARTGAGTTPALPSGRAQVEYSHG
jgi:hypothetical protein